MYVYVAEDQGKTRKDLVIRRVGAGKPGYYFNFSVTMKDDKDAALNSRWSIMVTEGESQVLKALMKASIPHLYVWDTRFTYEREEQQGEDKQ